MTDIRLIWNEKKLIYVVKIEDKDLEVILHMPFDQFKKTGPVKLAMKEAATQVLRPFTDLTTEIVAELENIVVIVEDM